MEVWEKVLITLLWFLIALSDIRRTLKTYRDYKLVDGNLIIQQTFLKEERYDLKTVSSWGEIEYYLLGFRTGRQIIVKTTNGIEIHLFERKSKNLDKLSEYLNEEIPHAYENCR